MPAGQAVVASPRLWYHARMRIVTVTPNPMLDKTLDLPSLQAGGINRSSAVAEGAGGKGINVARQLVCLGAETVATGFLGGATGERVRARCDRDCIPHRFVRIAAETREGWTLRPADGPATAVFEPPPAVTAAEVTTLAATVEELLAEGDWLALCGTLPQDCPEALYATLTESAHARAARVLIDACGTPLRAALATQPDIIKCNCAEYEQTFAAAAPSDAARKLAGSARLLAVVTDGAGPWYAATDAAVWQVTPPPVIEVNSIGCGDVLAAALLYGLSEGQKLPHTLTAAAALAAASAAQWDIACVSAAAAASLLPAVRCVRQ